MAKKRTWKFWTGGAILVLLLLATIWVVNLIWFKPFNIEYFYDRAFVKLVIKSPEAITQLGVPVLYGWTKDKLDDASDESDKDLYQFYKDEYKILESYNYDKLSKENKLNSDILEWYIKSIIDGEPFRHYNYPVNQMRGVQNNLPALMVNSHKLETESDVEAYISRLSKFGVKFDQVLEGLKIREEKEFIPPTFIIDNVITEMEGFTGTSTESPVQSNLLYTNFDQKVRDIKELTEDEINDYKQQVAQQIETTVFPAYQKMIDYFKALKLSSNEDAGAWKFPNGEAYYKYALKVNTTTNTDPAHIHQIGLREVARIKKEMWEILKAEGITDTALTMRQAVDTLTLSYPGAYLDTSGEDGPQKMLDAYESILNEIKMQTDKVFDLKPKAALIVRRIPEFKEGGTGAYYNAPAMDGSRPGIFFANLATAAARDSILTIGMKTLSYHEGIPGHHFQLAIQSELEGLPVFRTVVPFSAFLEGWGLYSEQLAFEMGMYNNDTLGNLGRLRAELFRSARLVVDTGLHSQRWTRDQSIDYLMENAFMSRAGATSETDRYIVFPGQACAYKIGMMKILELRERAKTHLSGAFDIKQFHNVILKNGAVPLDILEENINTYINEGLEKANQKSVKSNI